MVSDVKYTYEKIDINRMGLVIKYKNIYMLSIFVKKNIHSIFFLPDPALFSSIVDPIKIIHVHYYM